MLEVEDLNCGYGLLRAVHGANFRVEAGRITALLGPNGAGKSSTVMAIAGHVPVSSGDIRFAGESIAAESPIERTRRGVGLVPEGRRVFADLSVAENLLVGGYVHGREASRAAARHGSSHSFHAWKSATAKEREPCRWGEQQMLAIGRALMADPKVLLIDELSLGLMPAVVDQCFAAILDLVREGVAGVAGGAEHTAGAGARRFGGGAGVGEHRLSCRRRGGEAQRGARRYLPGIARGGRAGTVGYALMVERRITRLNPWPRKRAPILSRSALCMTQRLSQSATEPGFQRNRQMMNSWRVAWRSSRSSRVAFSCRSCLRAARSSRG